MPTQLTQLPAGQRVRAWHAVLDPADVQGRGLKVDLLPTEVDDFGRSEAVPVSQKHYESVALTLTVLSGGLDQALHLGMGEVFSGSQLGIPWSAGNCSIYSCWRYQSELRFCHDPRLRSMRTVHKLFVL